MKICPPREYTLSPIIFSPFSAACSRIWCGRGAAAQAFQLMYEGRDENFGNGRTVRNIFEDAVARQANRVAALEKPGREELMALLPEDLRDIDEEDNDT